MTDRELLEFAAKAAGIELRWHDDWCYIPRNKPPHNRRLNDEGQGEIWNPLTDDGDALRLAVKLGLHTMHSKHKVKVGRKLVQDGPCEEDKRPDPYAATRRAIVRAAAEIGKAMP